MPVSDRESFLIVMKALEENKEFPGAISIMGKASTAGFLVGLGIFTVAALPAAIVAGAIAFALGGLKLVSDQEALESRLGNDIRNFLSIPRHASRDFIFNRAVQATPGEITWILNTVEAAKT